MQPLDEHVFRPVSSLFFMHISFICHIHSFYFCTLGGEGQSSLACVHSFLISLYRFFCIPLHILALFSVSWASHREFHFRSIRLFFIVHFPFEWCGFLMSLNLLVFSTSFSISNLSLVYSVYTLQIFSLQVWVVQASVVLQFGCCVRLLQCL